MITIGVAGEVTGAFEVSRGTAYSTQVHPREIYKRAVLDNADLVLLAHNHINGDLEPSEEDIDVFSAIFCLGMVIKIPLIDTLIMNGDDYLSIQDKIMY